MIIVKSLITLLEMLKKDTYPINMSSLINTNIKTQNGLQRE